jgi:L-fuconolactonase
MIIDSYAHCGRTKYRPLEDVVAVLDDAGIAKAVLVQHMGEFDNSYIGEAVADSAGRMSAVALVDPLGDWVEALSNLAASGSFRGIRVDTVMLLDAPDMCGTALDAGFNLLIYIDRDDVIGLPSRIGELAARNRERLLVVSHYGLASAPNALFRSDSLAANIAAEPNARFILSGQKMFSNYPFADFHQPTRDLINLYGADRLMWGSNFPVCGSGGGYREGIKMLQSGVLQLSTNTIEQILWKTATATWF